MRESSNYLSGIGICGAKTDDVIEIVTERVKFICHQVEKLLDRTISSDRWDSLALRELFCSASCTCGLFAR